MYVLLLHDVDDVAHTMHWPFVRHAYHVDRKSVGLLLHKSCSGSGVLACRGPAVQVGIVESTAFIVGSLPRYGMGAL